MSEISFGRGSIFSEQFSTDSNFATPVAFVLESRDSRKQSRLETPCKDAATELSSLWPELVPHRLATDSTDSGLMQ